MKLKYAVVIEKALGNYCAYVPELGCVSTAKTRDGMLAMIREAMEVHIEDTVERGCPVPEPRMSLRDAMEYHIALCDEEFAPELGGASEDYKETETAFIMLEVEANRRGRSRTRSRRGRCVFRRAVPRPALSADGLDLAASDAARVDRSSD